MSRRNSYSLIFIPHSRFSIIVIRLECRDQELGSDCFSQAYQVCARSADQTRANNSSLGTYEATFAGGNLPCKEETLSAILRLPFSYFSFGISLSFNTLLIGARSDSSPKKVFSTLSPQQEK
jgi:hypothetical protein